MTTACHGASKTAAIWPCRANRHEIQIHWYLWLIDSVDATGLAAKGGVAPVTWCCADRCRPAAKPDRLLGFAYHSDSPSPTHAKSAKYEADWTKYVEHKLD